MSKDISYTYYRCALVGTWIFSFIAIIGTWLTFLVGGNPTITFSLIADSFLFLCMVLLSTLLFMSNRPNYRWKGLLVAVLALAHVAFCVAMMVIKFSSHDIELTPALWYICPFIHTAILLLIGCFGIYFTLRGRFVFKNPSRADAAAAFGGKIEDETINAEAPSITAPTQPNKPARDEKTGIVSL